MPDCAKRACRGQSRCPQDIQGVITVEMTFVARSDRFDADDERWLAQARSLVDELRQEVPTRTERSADPGTKGTVDTVILALGSAGVFTAAVECFKAWLSRDRSRRLELTVSVDGHEEKYTLVGTAVDDAAYDRLAEVVRGRIGGAS
jgi:hypothetical protein